MSDKSGLAQNVISLPKGGDAIKGIGETFQPYVLTEMSNNMGATTRVSYAPSTHYFLEDQASGTPWITKLPFPVQVEEGKLSISLVFNDRNKDMQLVGTFDPLQENNRPRGPFERRALELALMGEVATDVERVDGQWYYRRSIPPQQLQAGVCALPHQFPDRAYIGLDGCTHAQGAHRAGFLT